jgi:hypothetical protein
LRGKKAKFLRRWAFQLLKMQNISPSTDMGQYKQVKNCHAWILSEEKDPDGTPLRKHVLNPGTIFHANPFMKLYRMLKHETRGGH